MRSDLLRSALKRVRPTARDDVLRLTSLAASRRWSRRILNTAFVLAPRSIEESMHRNLADAFNRYPPMHLDEGAWKVPFGHGSVTVPMIQESAGLRWDFGLAILGHDPEVKSFYERALASPTPPSVFFDIGCNFGTHSLVFLANGVRVVSFEPNPACHPLFLSLCEANGWQPDLRATAVDDRIGTVDLSYPPDETWLGTTIDTVRDDLAIGHPLAVVTVPTTTLDTFVAESGIIPDLLKIDTEGNEYRVLAGARGTMREHRPFVVFESWPHAEARSSLSTLFAEVHYVIVDLADLLVLSPAAFCASARSNFVSVPRESLGHGWI
jgi:FkbM family methyltransferase